jgi:hypothetical protein
MSGEGGRAGEIVPARHAPGNSECPRFLFLGIARSIAV